MYYEWHNKYLTKENSLFPTILNYFRQILVAFKYFVQSDWRIIVKTKDSSCHRHNSVPILSGIRAAQSSVFCVVFCRPLFIILSFFVWPLHCLAALLQYMTSDNPFGIYKLFFSVDLFTHH